MARRTQPAETFPEPQINDVIPAAALPLGEIELTGSHLGPNSFGPPAVLVDGASSHVLMSRAGRLIFRVPEVATTGLVEVRTPHGASNAVPLRPSRAARKRRRSTGDATQAPCAAIASM